MGSNRLRYLLLFCVSVALGAIGLVLHLFPWGYFSSYIVTYDNRGYPLIVAELQGQSCLLAIDVGSRFSLFLPKKTLDEIDKQSQGMTEWHDISGQKHEAPSYFIPKMKIGNLMLRNIVANQVSQEDHGKLGRFLGEEFNFLLDFPRSRIVACDTFSKLLNKNLVDKDWVEIPFEMHRGGILLRIDTDFGIRTFALNTTSTISYLRSSFISTNHPFPFVSSSFYLGGQHFGNVTLELIDLPEGLNEIDGFIGMDFLSKHPMYLDYTHKMVYIKPPERYFEPIPITFASRGNPTIDVSIEGNIYSLELDLGSCFAFSMQEEILQNIGKIKYGTAAWHDFRGKKYDVSRCEKEPNPHFSH